MLAYPFPPGTRVRLPDGTPYTTVDGKESTGYFYWKNHPTCVFTPVLGKNGHIDVYLPESLSLDPPLRIINSRIL